MQELNILIQHLKHRLEELYFPEAADEALPQALPQTGNLDSRRLFHGRGKAFKGLEWCCVDYFYPVVLIVFYQEPPVEFELHFKQQLIALVESYNRKLTNALQLDSTVDKPNQLANETTNKRLIENISLQRRYIAGAPFDAWLGKLPEQVLAKRRELTFNLSFAQQNIGYFLDIEPARVWLEGVVRQFCVREQAPKVLNLFAYTCAFSVVAKAAGAFSVVNIDLSRRSLSTGKENHKLSQVDTENVHFFAHDIFKSWGKLKKFGPYNIVIIDPPSFQKGSFIAAKDYPRLLTRMQTLVASDGVFLACLNAPEILLQDFKSQIENICPEFICDLVIEENKDFPEAEQGRALKLLVFKRNDLGD